MAKGSSAGTFSFQAEDSQSGQIVTLFQRTSTLIRVFQILTIIAPILFAVIAGRFWFLSVIFLIVAVIFYRVFGFFRTKLDMDVERCALSSQEGGSVMISKRKSFWIPVQIILLVVLILVFLGALGILDPFGSPMSVEMVLYLALSEGVWIAVIVAAFVKAMLFLRKKVWFDDEEALIQTIEGSTVKLGKKRSLWVTTAMILSAIMAFALITLSVAEVFTFGALSLAPMIGLFAPPSESGMVIAATAVIILGAINSLVFVAVLNFLRIKVVPI